MLPQKKASGDGQKYLEYEFEMKNGSLKPTKGALKSAQVSLISVTIVRIFYATLACTNNYMGQNVKYDVNKYF